MLDMIRVTLGVRYCQVSTLRFAALLISIDMHDESVRSDYLGVATQDHLLKGRLGGAPLLHGFYKEGLRFLRSERDES